MRASILVDVSGRLRVSEIRSCDYHCDAFHVSLKELLACCPPHSTFTMSQSLHLIPLPYPLILLPGARATFPVPNKQAAALIHLADSSVTNPVLAAVPLVQHEGTTSLNKWGVVARITRFVRPRPHSDEPYLLTLTSTTRVCLSNPPERVPSDKDDGPPLPRVDVVHPPPDANSHPAPDVVQDFKTAAVRLLERFAQDTSQSARKRESWTRIAHLVEETESDKAAALADAIVSAVGAEHADKLGESLSISCWPNDRLSTRFRPASLGWERPSFGYISESVLSII